MEHRVESNRISALRDFNLLVPVDSVSRAQRVLPVALNLVGDVANSRVALIGVTAVEPDTPLSDGTSSAQRSRSELDLLADENDRIRRLGGSVVAHKPWDDIAGLIEERLDDRDRLLLPWQTDSNYLGADLGELLCDPPCNVAIVQSAVHPRDILCILLPVRRGPFANLASGVIRRAEPHADLRWQALHGNRQEVNERASGSRSSGGPFRCR